jgi:hypothetical protein
MISNIRNNSNRNYHISQHLILKDCWPVNEINQDPEFFFRNLTKTQHKLLEILLRWSLKYKNVYPRQGTLARMLKISREHCNRLLKWMKDKGLLVSEYRYKLSCHYTLSSFFFSESMRSRLSHIFRPLRALSLSLLFGFSSDVTQDIKKLIKNLINPIVQRSGEGSMKQFNQTHHGDKPVSEAIRELKCINLSRAGQIKLSAFPDEAIVDAANAYNYAKNVKEPFNWFYKLCMDYCNRNEITPDWIFMHSLLDSYKVSLKAPMLLPGPVRDKVSQPQKSFTNQRNGRSAEQVVPINATSSESQKRVEWKGHVEVQRPALDNHKLRESIINALNSRNYFYIDLMKTYSTETQQETINLLSLGDSCYCETLKETCGWELICSHKI